MRSPLVLSALLGTIGCGSAEEKAPPSDTQTAQQPQATESSPTPSVTTTEPLPLLTFVGTVPQGARTFLEWKGNGNMFPDVHSAVKQFGVLRDDVSSLCRLSPDLSTLRCVSRKMGAGEIPHRETSAWYATGRLPAPPDGTELLDLVGGTSKYQSRDPYSVRGSVDVDGTVRWLAGSTLARIDAAGDVRTGEASGTLVGPWVLRFDEREGRKDFSVRGRFVNAKGPDLLGPELDLGEAADQLHREAFGCWDHGHTGIFVPGAALLLKDQPDAEVKRFPRRGGLSRIEMLCTPEGFVASSDGRDDLSTSSERVEERCTPKGCERREATFKGWNWTSASLGATSIAVGIVDNNVVMRIAPFMKLPTVADRLIASGADVGIQDERHLDVDIVSNGEEAVVFVMANKGRRIESMPGPGITWRLHVVRVSRDGTLTPIRLETL
jgi:hypothetical protein